MAEFNVKGGLPINPSTGRLTLSDNLALPLEDSIDGGLHTDSSGGLACEIVGGGGGGALNGDVIGPLATNTVVQLTGAGGFVNLLPGTVIRQTQASAVPPSSATKIEAMRLVPATNVPYFEISMTTSPGSLMGEVDNQYQMGMNTFGANAGQPSAGVAFEQYFNANFEFYVQFAGVGFINPRRFIVYNYNPTTGASAAEIAGDTVNIGEPAYTSATNVYGAFLQHFPGGTLFWQSYLLGPTVGVIDFTPALSGLRSNGVGKTFFIQVDTGILALDAINGQLNDHLGTTHQFVWGDTGIGYFGHAQAAKQTVAGVKVDAVAASILAALVAYGMVTDATT